MALMQFFFESRYLEGDVYKRQGLLTRKIYPEVPPRVEYTLTETGNSLKPILESMFQWGTDYKKMCIRDRFHIVSFYDLYALS